jgi:dihydroorotase
MSRSISGGSIAVLLAAAAVLAALVGSGSPVGAQAFDTVISNGRVIDPESGLDAVRDVGIRSGRVVALSKTRLSAAKVIDASNLVVAPGFIDLHAHGQTPETYRFQAADGVTSSFELELGAADVDAWYKQRQAGRLINYGVSVGHIPVRMAVLRDPGPAWPTGAAAHRAASPAEVVEIIRRLENGLAAGAVSIGAGLPYTEAATQEELRRVFAVAGRNHVSIHVHIRPGIGGLQEALALAQQTHAPLHVVHLNSAATQHTREMLEMIDTARRAGRDVTTEAYPYTAGMTEIRSAILDEYEDSPDEKLSELEWPVTGEKLTRDTFQKYRAIGGPVIRRTNTDAMVALAIGSPLTAIASDAYWENGTGHPRTAGTFSRVLGRFVGDGSLTLAAALRKMTLLPAQRLESRVPGMKRKGRVRVGGDADLTIFDPSRVMDRATYQQPSLPSAGIEYVLVNGVPVVAKGVLVDGVNPGTAVRAPIKRSRSH